MTANPRLTHPVLDDVGIHVSAIVCLERRWVLQDPSPRGSAQSAAAARRHPDILHTTEYPYPRHRGTGLVAP